jgi:hypothetical protein
MRNRIDPIRPSGIRTGADRQQLGDQDVSRTETAGLQSNGRWRGALVTGTALLCVAASAPLAAGGVSGDPFETASVRFEQNATDGDVEVVFQVKGGDDGLAKLVVVAPDGRTVASFVAPDATTLGIRQFEFESPEPRDVASLKTAYPEGVYTFTGSTVAGESLAGTATLSHALPATASNLRPGEEDMVSAEDPEISWAARDDVAAWIVEIEHDELDVNLTAKLPGRATSFTVPDGFLQPGTEYDLGLGSVAEGGNISYVETSFTTADKE